MIVKETHPRTLSKTVAYRILCTIAILLITYFYSGSLTTSASVGLISVIVGSTLYYLHDRAWLFVAWHRNDTGNDTKIRSLVKTVVYRVIVMIAAFITFKFVATGGSNSDAAVLTIAQMVVNLINYYIVERFFDSITWGKKIPQEQEAQT
jgi:uncharacterized membrane protein